MENLETHKIVTIIFIVAVMAWGYFVGKKNNLSYYVYGEGGDFLLSFIVGGFVFSLFVYTDFYTFKSWGPYLSVALGFISAFLLLLVTKEQVRSRAKFDILVLYLAKVFVTMLLIALLLVIIVALYAAANGKRKENQ
jgi:hypothetical protein